MEISPSWDLVERLDAAALDRTNIHNSLCPLFDEDEDLPCSCGVPALLEDLAALLREGAANDVIRRTQQAA